MSLQSSRQGTLALVFLVLLPALVAAAPPTLDQIEGYWKSHDGQRDLDFRSDGIVLIKGSPFGWALNDDVLLLRSTLGVVKRFTVHLLGQDLEVQDDEGTEVHYLRTHRAEVPAPRAVSSDRGQKEFPYSLKAAGGFLKTSEHGGVVRLESPRISGSLMLIPADDLLTPTKLVEAFRQGWKDPTTQLMPRAGATLTDIPMGGQGHGRFFEVEGRLADSRVRGYLGGVFGPGDRFPFLLFATAPPSVWGRFSSPARSMLESIRFRGNGESVAIREDLLPEGPIRLALGMDLPREFRQTSAGDGVIYLSSSSATGAVMVLPAEGILTPDRLLEANREGWHGVNMSLRAIRPGMHQKIQLKGGSGLYFAVSGTVGGQPAEGFLAGVFGPGGRFPHLVLAFSNPGDWGIFSGFARKMLDSIRLDPLPKS